jgi:sulfate permease, SulP family
MLPLTPPPSAPSPPATNPVTPRPAALRWLPFLAWWPRVNRHTLRADALAGLVGALVLVPQGVAFATIAGMPPEYGLYAAMLPAIVAALWGSSWHLISGPTTAISIVVFATVSPLAVPGTAGYVQTVLTLTLLVGIVQLALGLARLGTLVNFISHTVIVGFTAGAAVLIAASQIGSFFGIAVERGSSLRATLSALFGHLSSVNPWVLAVSVATVLACVLCKRLAPRWPHLLIGMLVGCGVAAMLNAAFGGTSATGIRSVGALAIGLPPLSAPTFDVALIEKLAPIALAVALLGLTEAVSIARAIALKTGQRIDGNQEFVGQGLSNLTAAFTSGYACSGSFNRSGLNHAAGGQTPLAAIFGAVGLLIVLLFLAPLAVHLPLAAMAGLLMVVAWGLIDRAQIREILRVSRAESAVLIVTFVATLTLALEYAIYLGVLLSFVLYLNRTTRPPLERMDPGHVQWPPAFGSQSAPEQPNAVTPSLTVVRLHGSIFFGAVAHMEQQFDALDDGAAPSGHVLLLAAGINFVDLAGAHLLGHEAERRRTAGGALYLHNVKPEVREMLERSGVWAQIGAGNVFAAADDAPALIRARLAAAASSTRGASPLAGASTAQPTTPDPTPAAPR